MMQYAEHQGPASDRVELATLANPPAREWPDKGMTFLIAMDARRNPGSLSPAWEPVDLSQAKDQYVPMNSCGYAQFEGPGYLGTANLNACTAVAAAYVDERDDIQAFLAHYDPENVRTTGEDGRLKVSELLARFAGGHAVKVAVAYSREHNLPHEDGPGYDPEDFPVDAIVDECRKLPDGSSVLLVPYETSYDFADPSVGHMLYVGRSGSYRMDFGWNGHKLQVGEPEPYDERRMQAARAHATSYEEEYAGEKDPLFGDADG